MNTCGKVRELMAVSLALLGLLAAGCGEQATAPSLKGATIEASETNVDSTDEAIEECVHDMSDGLALSPDGVQIAYIQDGLSPCDAPSVVMIHGWPDNHHVFDAVVAEIEDRYHVVRYDLRGVGGSDKPPADQGHYRYPRQVDDLRAVVDALDIAAFHLVGHDWGGGIGYEATVTPDVRMRILTFTNISGPSVDQVASSFHPDHFNAQAPGAYLYMAHIWYIPALMAPMVPELLAETGLTSYLVQLQYALDDGDYNSANFADHQWSNLANLYRENIPERSQNPTFSQVDGLPLIQAVMPVDDTYVPPYYWDGKEQFHELMWKRPIAGGHWIMQTDPSGVVLAIDEAVTWSQAGTPPGPEVAIFENGSQIAGASNGVGEFSSGDDGSRCRFNLLSLEVAEFGGQPQLVGIDPTGECLR